MSLDLFFVPRKPDFATLRDPGHEPTRAQTNARARLVKALLAAFPGTELNGNANSGFIAGFPRGELSLLPGYISWTMHGVGDVEPIHEIVNWFHAENWVCEDPQDAGFANRDVPRGGKRTTLRDWNELEGARFVGLRLKREWVAGLAMEWLLADGGTADIHFVGFNGLHMPDLHVLLETRVLSVVATEETKVTGDSLRIYFEQDVEMFLYGALYQKSSIVRPVAKLQRER